MADQNQLLLQTKLHQPPIPRGLIDRPRLFDALCNGIDRPLTLICAPAGYGKTTLVCAWLNRLVACRGENAPSLPSAWLSLDEAESDLNLFISYFIAALRTIFEDACEKTLMLLQANQPAPQAAIHTMFFNDLEKLPGEAILVLDDYQLIHGEAVHNLLSELARHWPKPLHLVLISRIEPPLPLTSLRAKGTIGEIRTQDLRFTLQETTTYLSQSQLPALSLPTLQLLEERFEGWPAGLHLAALSLRSADSPDSFHLALSSEDANITGYLMDEVLTHQFPAIHSFLLKTSILDRICVPLCEAVVGEIDADWNARLCLDWIEHSELFLLSLDNRRKWYRYHPLFQELLQHRLSTEMAPDQVAHLHRQASTWFAEHGLVDEALHHALASGDLELAARQMSAGLRDVLNHVDRPALERWLRMLPEEMIQRRPELLMVRVWALQFTWRMDLQASVLQQVEDLLDAGGAAALPLADLQILRGQICLQRAQQAYFSNQQSRAVDLCRQALALLPSAWTFGRGAGMLYLGMSMQARGQGQEAERLLLAEYESYGNKSDIYALFNLESLCYIYLLTGQLEQTEKIAQLLFQGSKRSGIALMRNMADWFLGLGHYYRNQLEAAAQHFTQITENRFSAQITAYRDAVAGLALIHQIKGDNFEASKMVETIGQFDLELSGREDNRTRSLRARLMLLQGDLEGACRWADAFTDPPQNLRLMWLEEPQVTRARILLARGAPADLQLALEILDALGASTERTFHTRYRLQILALRAQALDAKGQTRPADAALIQALGLALPGDFIRVFVDLGKPMQAMLRRIANQNHSLEAIQPILAAFPADDKNLIGSESPPQPASHPRPGISPLVEPLTRRELEVLVLLRGPSSIKEIAQKLHISPATAKDYSIKIYGKLGVHRRWDAVAKAEELNILPPR